MINYKLKYIPNENLLNVALPLSKSESNRLLLISALAGISPELLTISKCDDTDAMLNGITTKDDYINVCAAGTAMRFLTAYFANCPGRGTIRLDGSTRMRQRPIAPLIKALREIGGDITYGANDGFPPLTITGTALKGGKIRLDASVSSQYISALLMIAPTFRESLEIEFNNKPVSIPYIKMTVSMMRRFGINVEMTDTSIKVEPGKYVVAERTVEADWSAASYWYELTSLSGRPVKLSGLKNCSLQGDSGISEIFTQLGVETIFEKEGVLLTPVTYDKSPLTIDLEDMPDVAQTIAVTSAMLDKPFFITGLSTLPSKETDRLSALKIELSKLGINVITGKDYISWNGEKSEVEEDISIETYKDHRMAMAFAPAAVRKNNLIINDIEVVSKSYPDYWDHLMKFGFNYCT